MESVTGGQIVRGRWSIAGVECLRYSAPARLGDGRHASRHRRSMNTGFPTSLVRRADVDPISAPPGFDKSTHVMAIRR
jgi:hypothetical protein